MMLQPTPPSTLSALRHTAFRALWMTALISNFGGIVQGLAAAWLMASLTPSSTMVALVQAAVTLPVMLLSTTAGVFADGFDRRRVMLAAQVFMMAVSILLALLSWQGLIGPWSLLVFTFLIGCGTALHNPSWQASMGDLVPRQDLPSAVALNGMSFNLMRCVGPAAGGLIVAAAGAATAFAVNAVSYVAIIAGLLAWRRTTAPQRLPRESFGSAFAAGLRYVAMSPNLMTVILRGMAFGIPAVAVQSLLPVVVRDQVGGDALDYGILLGCFGVGAVSGALGSPQIARRLASEGRGRLSFIAFGLACLLMAFATDRIVAAVALFVTGAFWVIALSLFNVTLQLSTPRWVVGRVIALYQTFVFGGMAGGAWLWGAIADVHGSPVALAVAGIALICGAAIGLYAPLPESDNLDLDPLDRFREPKLTLDITPRSGPIMITVRYRIAEADVGEFLELMRERRRIRIRDGARQWELLRDLEEPELWLETYHVPTWTEYVRHNERRTQSDREAIDRVRALHRGDVPPEVHRMIQRQTFPTRYGPHPREMP